MTIKELKDILNSFPDDSKDVIVWIPNIITLAGVEDASDNNGHLQLNVEEWEEAHQEGTIKISAQEADALYKAISIGQLYLYRESDSGKREAELIEPIRASFMRIAAGKNREGE